MSFSFSLRYYLGLTIRYIACKDKDYLLYYQILIDFSLNTIYKVREN